MAYFEGTIYSQTLHMDTHLAAVLPQDSRFRRIRQALRESRAKPGIADSQGPNAGSPDPKPADSKPRVLLLLHGLGDCGSNWITRTNAARYAEEHDLALIMPDVQKSFYQDMVYGDRYFTYVTEELPELAEALFGLDTGPAHLGVAGFSMGGYGALRCALIYPERYFACGAFSSACRIRDVLTSASPHPGKEQLGKLAASGMLVAPNTGYADAAGALFGWKPEPTAESHTEPDDTSSAHPISETSDLFYLASRPEYRPEALRLYMACGESDSLLDGNQKLQGILSKKPYADFAYQTWSGGHDWSFWDTALKKFMEWIDADRSAAAESMIPD